MPPSKKRNYSQFVQNQLIQPTLHEFRIDTVDQKHKRNLNLILLEAKQDFQDCLVRLQNFQNKFDCIVQSKNNDTEQRKHLSLAQRRKKFQQQLMKNPYFKLMIEKYPQLKDKASFELKYMFRQRQFLNITQKIQIIELRFGTYGSLVNQQLTYQKIAMRVGTKVSSVVNVVRRYVKQDAQLKIGEKRGGRPSKLSQLQIKEICSPHQLRQQAHLSLEKRCDLIQEKYSVKISRFTLAKLYRDNEVSYLKTHKSFYSRFTEEQLTKQRLEFISKIARFLHQNNELLYMDETSTNVWETRNKMWQPTNTKLPMAYTLPNQRGSNVTIIGAISNQRNRIFYKITSTTNTENVLAFFSDLNKDIGLANKVIVMDNHAAHHSKAVTNFISKHGGVTLFMPPISSYFNPIETIWSWVKGQWRNELMKIQGAQPSKKYMNSTLARICDEAPPSVVTNIANSCIGFMQKYYLEYSARQAQQ